MKIDVIIPTLNPGESLTKLLKSLRQQTVASEILIIDSQSDENVEMVAKQYGCYFLREKRDEFTHGGTRHKAVQAMQGDIVVFMTQDALPYDKELLERLITPLQDKQVAASFARQIPYEEATTLELLTRQINYPSTSRIKSKADIPEMGIKTYFFSDVCSAVKRIAYNETGGFPAYLNTNEDMYMAWKLIQAGYGIAYVAEAAVWHSHNLTLWEQFKRNQSIGQFMAQHPEMREEAGTAEGEGFRFVRNMLQLLWQEEPLEIPYFFLDTLARYSGYRYGLLKAGR